MKLLQFDDLKLKVQKLRESGKSIVLCHGVFDLLHIGHIRYLRQARNFGDVLVVTITEDQYVDKGPNRPAFSQELRAEAIASLDCVDYVAINRWPTAEETLRLLKPDFYVKGSEFKDVASDMTGKIGRELEIVREIGAELVFTEDIVFSSSNLINRYLSSYPEVVNEYLAVLRKRYGVDDVLGIIDRMSAMKVLVVGDAILDEYQYCTAMGLSSKDPALALKYQTQELFAGGVLAVANHVGNFTAHVQLLTLLGEKDRHEGFIRSQLSPHVYPNFVTQPGAPTLIKRRFVESNTFNKLLEVYVMDDGGLPEAEDARLCEWLNDQLPKYDLVVAADFGHGAISDNMVKTLVERAPFLAVNTQANAGNRGFHTINRYPRADYVSMALHELRLATGDNSKNERTLTDMLARKLGCRQMVVTLGRRGCLVWSGDADLVEVPAFAMNVVDRVGAGDSFFAVTSMAAAMDIANEVLGFIGNVAGAEAVGIIGNKKPVEKMNIKKHITAMLK